MRDKGWLANLLEAREELEINYRALLFRFLLIPLIPLPLNSAVTAATAATAATAVMDYRTRGLTYTRRLRSNLPTQGRLQRKEFEVKRVAE